MNSEKVKVLIIDDDAVNSRVVSSGLTRRGFHVESILDESTYEDYFEREVPDVLLLDISMPKISGLEILHSLRERFKPVELPIIMETASEQDEDVITSLKLGANDYVTKPITMDVLEARINTQVELKKLYNDSVRKSQLEAINAMITTYNHEINNPLAIAMSGLDLVKNGKTDHISKVEKALLRIRDIVQQIKEVENSSISLSSNTHGASMIELQKKTTG